MPGLGGLSLPVPLENGSDHLVLVFPGASRDPAHGSCSPSLDGRTGGKEGGRKEEFEAGAGPEGLRGSQNSHLVPVPLPRLLGALPFLPPRLSLRCPKAQFPSCPVSFSYQTNERLGLPSRSHQQAGCQLQ